MLTVHHLGVSQSERIVWLCEELEIPYRLEVYARDPTTRLAPPAYRALHPLGVAPVITEGPVVMAESGAIVDYILARYGNGRLSVPVDHPEFPDYLYWFHFSNGTLQPGFMRLMIAAMSGQGPDHPLTRGLMARQAAMLAMLDQRLADHPYLAGEAFTAADVVIAFSLTTMRVFQPFDIRPYPHILAYLKRLSDRPAYRRALEKGDPGMTPLID